MSGSKSSSRHPPAAAGSEAEWASLPVSERVRHRLVADGCRFHANDNIADYIHDGEFEELKAEVEARLKEVLRSLVIDTESDHNTNDTAQRVAKMYLQEVFRGRYVKMPPVTEFPNVERLNELMIVGPVKVRSACSHHLCPILGRVWIGVLPNELQERVKPDGLAIVMEADHFCMHWRGIKDDESMMTNSVMRGAFLKDATLRREFLSLLSKKDSI
jgi:GTP cyclohydrolase I